MVYPPLPPGGWVPGPLPGPPPGDTFPGMGGGMFPQPGPSGVIGGSGGSRPGMDGTGTILDVSHVQEQNHTVRCGGNSQGSESCIDSCAVSKQASKQ